MYVYDKKGVSLVALVATITIIVILILTVIIAGNNMLNNVKKSNFLKEINAIQERFIDDKIGSKYFIRGLLYIKFSYNKTREKIK